MFNNQDIVLNTLCNARDLISDKENWTKKYLATTIHGEHVYTNNPDAQKFCAVGAIKHVSKDHTEFVCTHNFLNNIMHPVSLTQFNDKPKTTHEDVLWLFDSAIKFIKKSREYA